MGTESFHTTRWTLVRHASDQSATGREALEELCGTYYEPVVAFLRRGGRDPEAARETAHEFFARVLETPSFGGAEPGRGRFRSYLLGALKHYLSHQRERAGRQKRGAMRSAQCKTRGGPQARDGDGAPRDDGMELPVGRRGRG